MSNDPHPTPDPEPTPDPSPAPAQDPEPEPDSTDWKSEARKWETRAKENSSAAARLKEFEDKDKTETQRLTEDRDGHKTRADTSEASLVRLEVALEKAPEGMKPAEVLRWAKRLSGSTKEELEADAAELFESFGGTASSPGSSRPQERLRGGGDPDEEPDPDLTKVIADIPR